MRFPENAAARWLFSINFTKGGDEKQWTGTLKQTPHYDNSQLTRRTSAEQHRREPTPELNNSPSLERKDRWFEWVCEQEVIHVRLKEASKKGGQDSNATCLLLEMLPQHHRLLRRWPQLCPYPLQGPQLFPLSVGVNLQLYTMKVQQNYFTGSGLMF